MTHNALARIEEILADAKPSSFLIEKSKKILASGTLNLDDYEDNYEVPKYVLAAALRLLADHYEPLGPVHGLETIKQLYDASR